MNSPVAGTAVVKFEGDWDGLSREISKRINPIAKDFGGKFGKAVGPVMKQQSKHLESFTTAAKFATAGAAGLAAYGFKDIVEKGAAFEKQMSVNAAITEANTKQQARLEKQSIQLGKATFYSAGQSAEAQAELAKGGLTVQQILGGGLPAALSLAEAGELELATAAETTVNAMALFGLEGKEASSVADMLSTAANRTTANVLDFAMAMKQGGSVTKLAGYGMDETVTILEALAKAGVKNSDAGTSMKTAVIQLLKPSKKQAELQKQLNLQFVDSNGNLKSAVGISKELQRATGDMTNAERAKTLATLAGTDGVRTLNALYALGPEKLRAFERANLKQGTAQEIARKKMDNFAGDLEQLKGSIETAEISIYRGMAPALSKLAGEAELAANNVGSIFEDDELSGSEKVEKAIGVLDEELEGMWERNHVTEHLVNAFDAAIPIVAENAGHAGLLFAEGFAHGFLHADPLGKAVMAAWALHFIGGKAPFIAAGKAIAKSFGVTAFSTVEGAASQVAARGSTPANPIFVKESMIDVGPRGGPVGGGKVPEEGPGGGGALATLSRAFPSAGGGVEGLTGPGAVFGLSVLAGHLSTTKWGEEILGRDPKREAEAARRQRAARQHSREGVRGGHGMGGPFGIPDTFNAIAGTAPGEKVIAKALARARKETSHGLADINHELSTRLHQASETWGKNTPKWAQSTGEAMRLAVHQIHQGIENGTINAQVGQRRINQLLAKIKFGGGGDPIGLAKSVSSEFQKAGGVTDRGIHDWLHKVEALPKGSREQAIEAINGMVKSWAAGHPKLEAQFDRLTQAEKNKFGSANKQVESNTRTAMTNTTNAVTEAAQQSGAGMSNIFDNLSNALQAVGASKIPEFSLIAVSRDPNGASLGRQQGGPIPGTFTVPGTGTGDSFRTVLPAGSFVENRNAARMPFQSGGMVPVALEPRERVWLPPAVQQVGLGYLQARNATWSRFQAGGLAHPALTGPEPMRELGQRSIDKSWKAAQKYLRAHSEPQRILNALQALRAQVAIGWPYVYGGGHGAFHGPFDCSGLVSYGLHAADFISAPMSVQQGSGLYTLGAAGPGKYLTWGVRGSSGMNAHTMMAVKDPKGRWEYFEAGGSGGGTHSPAGWDGSFQLRHMPGFQRGGAVGMPEKAREAIAKWGQQAFDPRSKHFVGWGYQRGGLVPRLKLAKGGWVKVGYTTYDVDGPGAGGDLMKGHGYAELGTAGANAGGNYLAKALGRSGELPMEFPLEVKVNRTGTLYKRDRGSGQAGDPFYAIDIHRLAWKDVGLSDNSKGDAWVRPASGAGSDEHSFKEDVPNVYRGVSTQTLHFPSVPKNLDGIDREIQRWQREGGRFTAAIRAARKAKQPAVAQALEHNKADIANHLRDLRNEKVKLRRAAAKKRFSKRLQRRFGKLSGYETAIEAAQRVAERRGQDAEQIVDLEPLQPEIPAQVKGETDAAYEAKREGMEKAYVAGLTGYIEGKERPAYQSVLAAQADWRNSILAAERAVAGDWAKQNFVGGMEGGWEDRIVALVQNEESIQTYAKNVGDDLDRWHQKVDADVRQFKQNHPGQPLPDWIKNEQKELPDWLQHEVEERKKLLEKLPFLKFKEGELRTVLGEGRALFYPGKADGGVQGAEKIYELLSNPRAPLPGSGDFEESLKDVQGLHWPDGHEFLASLPGTRQAGQFGGAIWDTQGAIEELSLKIAEAGASIEGSSSSGSGEEDSTKAERLELENELLRQATQRGMVSETLRNTIDTFNKAYPLPPYAGKAHTGAIVPGPAGAERTMILRSGEGVFTQEQMDKLSRVDPAAATAPPSGPPSIDQLIIHPDGRVTMRYEGRDFETAVKKVVRTTGIGR